MGVLTQTSDCAVTWMVYILNCIVDVISYVKVVLLQVEYCDEKSNVYDVIHSAYGVTRIVRIMSYKSG